LRVGAAGLPERLPVELETAGVGSRPRDALPRQPALEPVGLERRAVVHAVVSVDLGDQVELDGLPAAPQPLQQVGVDRHAGLFHPGDGRGVPAAQQRMAEALGTAADGRQHPLQQRPERVDVGLAVVQQRRPLGRCPARLLRQRPPGGLLLLGDAGYAVPG
jgi:hypothetical protein